ncbi:MAG: hypothetical protein NTY88_11480 [Bacteroidetes bacterium]|nr:hypothetical protein [Bacteroidota bacterium]
MPNNKFRVVIPPNADGFLILIGDIIKQEDSLAPNGMLTPAELQKLKDLRTDAGKANEEQKKLAKQAEDKTKVRDLAFGRTKGQNVSTPDTCEYFVTKVRDKALSDNKTNPKAIGAWGFVVDDSPKVKKKPKM